MTERITFTNLTSSMMQHYENGEFASALALIEKYMPDFPDQAARITFWRMCLLNLCNRTEDILSVFRYGLDSGLWWAESQFRDSDLDSVRKLPEFKSLVDASIKKSIEAQAQIGHDKTILAPDDVIDEPPLLITLHGRNGDKNYNLEYWEIARQRGWLVLSPQSRQAIYPGSYCWDKSEQGLDDILFHLKEIIKTYNIDHKRVVIAGFSQGGGMAIYAALSGKVNIRGFISVGTSIAKPNSLIPLAGQGGSVRGYFVVGKKDYALEKARAVQKILKENNFHFDEEVHADLGHEFPPDFTSTFDKAIEFILE